MRRASNSIHGRHAIAHIGAYGLYNELDIFPAKRFPSLHQSLNGQHNARSRKLPIMAPKIIESPSFFTQLYHVRDESMRALPSIRKLYKYTQHALICLCHPIFPFSFFDDA
mmetsp:Transcript_37690/g.60498  ORF Transcript_37690/g.60498 Transcript_37690/m.60498 type:complete len:111 (+) Transcript_37690:573-905(+)